MGRWLAWGAYVAQGDHAGRLGRLMGEVCHV